MARISENKAIRHTDELGWPLCCHDGEDHRVMLQLSTTQRHPNKMYYRCGQYDNQCSYFIWVEHFEAAVDRNHDEFNDAASRAKTRTRRHIVDICRVRNDSNKLEGWSQSICRQVLADFDKGRKERSESVEEEKEEEEEEEDEIEQFTDDEEVDKKRKLYDVNDDATQDSQPPTTPKKGANTATTAKRPKKARTTDVLAFTSRSSLPPTQSTHQRTSFSTSSSSPSRRRSKDHSLLDYIAQQGLENEELKNTIDSLRTELKTERRDKRRVEETHAVETKKYHEMLIEAYKKL